MHVCFPSKHAESDSHPIRITWEALVRSGSDDSCTPACLRTGSVWPKPELNRIPAGFAQYYTGIGRTEPCFVFHFFFFFLILSTKWVVLQYIPRTFSCALYWIMLFFFLVFLYNFYLIKRNGYNQLSFLPLVPLYEFSAVLTNFRELTVQSLWTFLCFHCCSSAGWVT